MVGDIDLGEIDKILSNSNKTPKKSDMNFLNIFKNKADNEI